MIGLRRWERTVSSSAKARIYSASSNHEIQIHICFHSFGDVLRSSNAHSADKTCQPDRITSRYNDAVHQFLQFFGPLGYWPAAKATTAAGAQMSCPPRRQLNP